MNDTTLDTLMINVESSSKDSTDAIDSLINKLRELNKELNNITKSSKSMSSLKSGIKATSSSARTKSNKAPEESLSAQDQLKKMGYGHIDLSKMTPYSTSSFGVTEINRYKTALGETVIVTKNTETEAEKARVNVRNLNNEAGRGANVFDLMKSSISGTVIKLQYVTNILRSIVPGLGRAYKAAAGYTEALNLFTVTMGDYAEKGLKWVEKFSDALYLDPTNVMQYMGSFNSLIKGLGTGSDRAYLMSKNLTQLTYDLASFKNLDFETAYQKLMSGISGELEPLRNTGVALSQVTLQQLAYSLGIQQNIQDMNEAQKAQLRYIQIMKSSTEWQTDMGRTLMSPANALRVVQQQFLLLAKAIGNVFIPIVMNVIPYVMVLTKWLTTLANKIAAFFGYKIKDTGGVASASTYQTMSTGLGSVGKAADATNKKLHTTLAAFDDLNVVQSKSESGGAGGGAGGAGAGDLPVDLPEYDALANLTDKFKDKMKDAEKTLKRILPLIAAIGGALALWKVGKNVLSLFNLLGGSGGAVAGLKTTKSLLQKIKGMGFGAALTNVLKVVGKVAGVVGGLVSVFMGSKGLYDAVYNITNGTKTFSESLGSLAGNLGLVVAGATVVGAILGKGPIGAAIGAVTGLVIAGISAWAGYNKGLEEIAKSKVFGTIHISVDEFSNSLNNLKTSYGEAAGIIANFKSDMDTLSTSFIENSNNVDHYLASFQYLGTSIQGETGEQFKSALDNMFKGANDIIDRSSQFSVELWSTSFKRMTGITEEEQINILNAIAKNDGYVKTEMNDAQTKINDIWQNAISTRGYLTTEEYNNMQELIQKIRDLTGEEMSKTQANVEYYKQYFGDKNHKLDEESYKNYQKARKKHEEEQLAIIEDAYVTAYNDAQAQINKLQKQRETANDSEKAELDKQISALQKAQKEAGKTREKDTKELGKKLKEYDDAVYKNAKETYGKYANDTTAAGKKIRKTLENVFKDAHINTKELDRQFKGIGYSCAEQVKKGFNDSHLSFNIEGKSDFSRATLKARTSGGFATGGFPDSATLFYANENGIPEMVGRIGGRTAVANNDQITTSITNALLTALNNYDFGGSKSPTTIYIGNKKVYEGMGEYSKTENDRYGTNMIRV